MPGIFDQFGKAGLGTTGRTTNLSDTAAGRGVVESLKNIGRKASDMISNPSLSRLNINNILPGAFKKAGADIPDIFFGGAGGGGFSGGGVSDDWRVRVTAAPAGPFTFSDGPMAALAGDGGVVFPITPNVSVSHNAGYGSMAPTHSNYPSYFYNNSEVGAISVSADFTAQTPEDAAYVLGMIWFFRSATKMFYGGPQAGNPPPIVYIDGYGDYYLPHVSCVVTNFSHSMPANIDYIETTIQQGVTTSIQSVGAILPPQLQAVQTGLATSTSTITNQLGSVFQSPQQNTKVTSSGKRARIPTKSTISLTLQPVYSRNSIANKFTWEDFSKGALLKGNGGFL